LQHGGTVLAQGDDHLRPAYRLGGLGKYLDIVRDQRLGPLQRAVPGPYRKALAPQIARHCGAHDADA